MNDTSPADGRSHQNTAAERFAHSTQHRELPKDSIPLRRGKSTNDKEKTTENRIAQDRKSEIAQFEKRVAARSGDRDKHGVAHVEDVAAKRKELRQTQAAAERFGALKSSPQQTPNKSNVEAQSPSQPNQTAAQRFQNSQSQAPPATPARSQSQGMSR